MQNIHFEFTKAHEMLKYHNALLRYRDEHFYVDVDLEHHSDRPLSKNHVTLKCSWKTIVEECAWEDNKMVRFKLIEEITDSRASLSAGKPVMIPVFDMC